MNDNKEICKYKMQIEALELENRIMKKNIAKMKNRKCFKVLDKIQKNKAKVVKICKRKK